MAVLGLGPVGQMSARTAAYQGATGSGEGFVDERLNVARPSGVYGRMRNPMPMLSMLDKGITLRMGRAHVRRRTGETLPLLHADDPLRVSDPAAHHIPLGGAPGGDEPFQQERHGAVTAVLRP